MLLGILALNYCQSDPDIVLFWPLMLMMRLQRVGRKNDPSYRIVVTDKRTGPKSNKHVAILGSYNPKMDHVQIKADEAKEWLSKGVQPSDTVHNILVAQKVLDTKKLNVLPKKAPIVDEEAIQKAEEEAAAKAEAEKAEAEAAEASDTEEAPAEESAEEATSDESAPEEAGDSAEVEETPAEEESTDDTPTEAPAEPAAEEESPEEKNEEEAPAAEEETEEKKD